MIYVVTRAYFNPSCTKTYRRKKFRHQELFLLQLLTSFVPLALLILTVLGSILLGLATPAEAAAIGAFGGLFLAFVTEHLIGKH